MCTTGLVPYALTLPSVLFHYKPYCLERDTILYPGASMAVRRDRDQFIEDEATGNAGRPRALPTLWFLSTTRDAPDVQNRDCRTIMGCLHDMNGGHALSMIRPVFEKVCRGWRVLTGPTRLYLVRLLAAVTRFGG